MIEFFRVPALLETAVSYFLNTWIQASRCKEGKPFGVTFSLVRSTHLFRDLATTAGRSSDCFATALPILKFAKFTKLFAECPGLLKTKHKLRNWSKI